MAGSGIGVLAAGRVFTSFSAGMFTVGTSGTNTNLPNTAGFKHIVRVAQSTIVYIAASGVVNSGVGFMLGDGTRSAQIELNISNLNLMQGQAVTSSVLTYVSFNY